MSKERELLLLALDFLDPRRWLDPSDQHALNVITRDIELLLAQPEQEPTTRHALDSYWNQEAYQRGYAHAVRDLKREPLSDKEITKNTPKLIHIGERLAFHAGVRFAEKHHGIGGGE
jgi:hypothetical protein